MTTNGKIAYAAVLYICYGMLLTALEIPYNAILPTMSKTKWKEMMSFLFPHSLHPLQ